MSYTLGQAAKATGVSKMTLSRAVKKGTISATKNENGAYLIDPAELHRVFPPATTIQSHDNENVAIRYTNDTALLHQIKELEIRLEVTKERLEETKQERDEWREQAQRLSLTHQKPVDSDKAILATSVPENRFRPSGGQIFGLACGILLTVMVAMFWPGIRARLMGYASLPAASAGIQQPAVTIQPKE